MGKVSRTPGELIQEANLRGGQRYAWGMIRVGIGVFVVCGGLFGLFCWWAAIAPNPPIIDEPANVVVEVTTSVVGVDGVVRAAPTPGQLVQLFTNGQWDINGNVPETTDANGLAAWSVSCTGFGSQPLSVVVNSADIVPLNLAPCAPVPTTTTPTVPPTTTSGHATTTLKQSRRTTTTGP